jgi:hypothetical protein
LGEPNSHGGEHDVKVSTRKLAVFAACLGIAGAFPVLSSADKGGVPHSQKPCKPKKHKKKHPKPNNKGKKCGFNFVGTTTVTPTTVASPTTVSTDTETETESTTTATTGS